MSHQTEEIIASAGGAANIPPHPEGQFPATCIDVVDLGMVETTWQGSKRMKHKILIRFFCGEWFDTEEGQRPLWVDQRFTLSLHENSGLRPFLETWRGQKFTEDELRGFNVAKLLHAHAFLQLSHNRTPERTYTNIDSIIRLPKSLGEGPGVPQGYVRVKDRPPKDGKPNGKPLSEPDDDLPF